MPGSWKDLWSGTAPLLIYRQGNNTSVVWITSPMPILRNGLHLVLTSRRQDPIHKATRAYNLLIKLGLFTNNQAHLAVLPILRVPSSLFPFYDTRHRPRLRRIIRLQGWQSHFHNSARCGVMCLSEAIDGLYERVDLVSMKGVSAERSPTS